MKRGTLVLAGLFIIALLASSCAKSSCGQSRRQAKKSSKRMGKIAPMSSFSR